MQFIPAIKLFPLNLLVAKTFRIQISSLKIGKFPKKSFGKFLIYFVLELGQYHNLKTDIFFKTELGKMVALKLSLSF